MKTKTKKKKKSHDPDFAFLSPNILKRNINVKKHIVFSTEYFVVKKNLVTFSSVTPKVILNSTFHSFVSFVTVGGRKFVIFPAQVEESEPLRSGSTWDQTHQAQ